jgi:hypothetical protein
LKFRTVQQEDSCISQYMTYQGIITGPDLRIKVSSIGTNDEYAEISNYGTLPS